MAISDKHGEYTAGRGTPARRHDGTPKGLNPSEHARVVRIRAQETSVYPATEGQLPKGSLGEQEARRKTNKYSDEVDTGEEV